MIVVQGIGESGSAVAIACFRAGFGVFIHDGSAPKGSRRSMAFIDAAFGEFVELEGVEARVVSPESVATAVEQRRFIPIVLDVPLGALLSGVQATALVDARMKKRQQPASMLGLAPLTIGIGPGFVVGANTNVAIESSWEDLGRVYFEGQTLPLGGEPRQIAGIGRSRFVYASAPGIWRTTRRIGEEVVGDETVGTLGLTPVEAPLAGAIRGLTHTGVSVDEGDKIVEIDPRGSGAIVNGLGERPRALGNSVLNVLREKNVMPMETREN